MRRITERLHAALHHNQGVLLLREHPELAAVIRSHTRRGMLIPVLPGTYTCPKPDLATLARAVHAWDPDAVICGAAAAKLTFMADIRVPHLQVASHRRPSRHHRGLRFQRRQVPVELTFCGFSRPELTAIDLAAHDGGHAICEALRQRAATVESLGAALTAVPRRRGHRRRHRALAAAQHEPWSVAELQLHRILQRSQLPEWATNHPVKIDQERYYLDIAFPNMKLAIEIDGFGFHSNRTQFETDREKQNALVAQGWTILRFTWRMITEQPHQVLAKIRALLARLAAQPRSAGPVAPTPVQSVRRDVTG